MRTNELAPTGFLRWLLALSAAALLATGCGTGQGRGEAVTPEEINPTLTALAEAVDPVLREEFPDAYGGIELDHGREIMTVYRFPDEVLEARVREMAGAVTVEFKDADFVLQDMEAVVARVTADIESWRSEGIDVSGASPSPDASGIVVYVTSFDADAARVIQERYAPMSVTVEERTVIAPTGSPEPMPTQSGSLEPKETADHP